MIVRHGFDSLIFAPPPFQFKVKHCNEIPHNAHFISAVPQFNYNPIESNAIQMKKQCNIAAKQYNVTQFNSIPYAM